MIADLTTFFAEKLTPRDGQRGDRISHEVRFAAAALMLVCAKADFEDHPEEQAAIIMLLERPEISSVWTPVDRS